MTEENMHMADQEQLDILRQGVKTWNAWKKQHPNRTYDFSYADLKSANLSHADLKSANLSHANLINADISHANLSHADLSHADLIYTNLRGAIVIKANLSNTKLSHALLSGAELDNSNLTDANLYNSKLSHAHLRGAYLSKTNLTNANLYNADLSYADLSYADLRRTDLSGVHLYKATFSSAVFGWTIFGRVDLRTVTGLKTVRHTAPSTIGTDTLEQSQGNIPDVFLRGAGLNDTFIEYAHALMRKPIDYYPCFISYSSKDEDFAKRLYTDLQSAGVRCWFAPEDMDIGDIIQHTIDASIRKYDKLLLILSEHSIASDWVAYEVKRALNKEPAGAQNVLYPVRLDKTILTCETDWAQDIKQTRHIGNFEEWKTNHDIYQDSFKRLLRALKQKDMTKKTGK